MNLRKLYTGLVLSVLLVLPQLARAQGADLSAALGGAWWGMSVDEFLTLHRDRMLEEYRTSVAGLDDPMAIDNVRRANDAAYNEIAGSLETFESLRTGYEMSAIGGEVVGGQGQQMVTVRTDTTQQYFIFTADRLSKAAVVYGLEPLDYIGFEGFVERLEQLYGRPLTSNYEEDDIGIRHLRNAAWEDGATRLRAEDRSQMFASYVLVYTDATVADLRADVTQTTRALRSNSGSSVTDMLRTIEERGTTSSGGEHAVDALIGGAPEVDLTLGRPPSLTGEGEGSADGREATALDDDEELDDAEQISRPRRTDDGDDDEDEDDDDGGVTIY